jgi:putative hemolysin
MSMIAVELAIVLALVLLNAALALSELAIVSASRPRLRALAADGRSGAATALALAEQPGRFLPTVQLGITGVGVLAGAFSGVTLAAQLAVRLQAEGLSVGVAEVVSFAVVVGGITYFSLVVGELVPKQLALRNPEVLACAVAPAMRALSVLAAPGVALLDVSTRLGLRVFGQAIDRSPRVTDEEIKALIAEAESAGVVEPEERRMLTGVLHLGDRPLRTLITPRQEVEWIDLAGPPEAALRAARASSHAFLPAARGSLDELTGALAASQVLAAQLDGRTGSLGALVREAPVLPESASALDALESFRGSRVPLGLVVDEHGTFLGVLTPTDILEAIAGSLDAGEAEPAAVHRADGSWLLDGAAPLDEASERLGIRIEADRPVHTVAGFVISELDRVPRTGDRFAWRGWCFEVVDMDRRRVDKVLATPPTASEE